MNFSRFLLIILIGGAMGCTSVPSVDFPDREAYSRIGRISAIRWKELDFQFNDNADDSDLEIERGMDLYGSRADGALFAPGRYRFHLELDAAYPDRPQYKERSVQTGTFVLGQRLSQAGNNKR